MANADVTDKPAAKVETTAINPIEAAMLEAANLLDSDSNALSDEVDKARAWDDSLFGIIQPMRLIMANLDKTSKGAILDAPEVSAVQDALRKLDIDDNVAEVLQTVQKWTEALKPAQVDVTPDQAITDLVEDLGNTVKSRMMLKAADVSDSTIDTAKAALARHHAMQGKAREYLNKTNRVVPSQTGTSGPKPSNGGMAEKRYELTFVTDSSLGLDEKGDPFRYDTTSPQLRGSVIWAMKEKLGYATRNTPQTYGRYSPEYAAISAALDELGDTSTTPNPGYTVQIPGVGTITRK